MAIYSSEESKLDCNEDKNQASLFDFGLYDYPTDRECIIKKWTTIFNQNFV